MVVEVVDKMLELFKSDKSFILSGGAGSGKTHSLKNLIDKIYENTPNAHIACITYTEVATAEIKDRCLTPDREGKLWISTIHSFLWDNIKNYKKQLRMELINLINKNEIRWFNEDGNKIEDVLNEKFIEYKNYRKIIEGIIWHDDVLKLSFEMFKKYKMLRNIFSCKYDYILVDEYQDTDPKVIDIFIDMIKDNNIRTCFGFFGDSMQSIYSGGVGDLEKYINDGTVIEIKKEDNYRCSQAVINLCNKIRIDNLIQKAAHRNNNGDIDNKEGKCVFVYSDNDISAFEQSKFYAEIFENRKPDKELYLTHNLISKKFYFNDLFEVYKGHYDSRNSKLFGDAKDDIANYLDKVAELVYLYKEKYYNKFIVKTDFKIKDFNSKVNLKEKMDMVIKEGLTIDNIVSFMDELNLLKVGDVIEENSLLYSKIKDVDFKQVYNLYCFEHDLTPYSTQHGVKGAEFDNVLVIMDNGNWNQYNFKKLFLEKPERTLKLFYVCISRAKNNLVVFMQKPTEEILNEVRLLFGDSNVLSV